MTNKAQKSAARTTEKDRRSSPRFRTRALTDGSVVSEAAKRPQSFLGTTVNVSEGGALVRTYEALAAGQEVSLKMHLPEGDLCVSGKVLHVEQDAVGCRLAGVRFGPLASEPAGLLARHLRNFLDAPGGGGAAPSSGEPAPSAAATPAPARAAVQESTAPRKSLRKLPQKTTVVFPFEGVIHRS
jgi:hypothetical protein